MRNLWKGWGVSSAAGAKAGKCRNQPNDLLSGLQGSAALCMGLLFSGVNIASASSIQLYSIYNRNSESHQKCQRTKIKGWHWGGEVGMNNGKEIYILPNQLQAWQSRVSRLHLGCIHGGKIFWVRKSKHITTEL